MIDGERANSSGWGQSGIEPTLDELLTDPATVALMRADRVTVEDIRMIALTVKAVPRRKQRPFDLT